MQADSLPAEPRKPVSNFRTKNVFLCVKHFAYALLSLHVNLKLKSAVSSSVLAWRIPGMGEPAGLPSMGSHRVGHD